MRHEVADDLCTRCGKSGRPFTVGLLPEIDNSNTGVASLGFGANNRPNRIASGTVENPGPSAWFDTRAFVFAPYGSFGTCGRNILDGPGYQDVTLSSMKDSPIREGLRMDLGEASISSGERSLNSGQQSRQYCHPGVREQIFVVPPWTIAAFRK